MAGITVGVVALPLALAFGVTSGLGAAAGVVTAIVAGVVAGVFGGSDVQVSGPTGAMTVVLVPVVARFGANGVLVVALLAGVVLIAAGLAKLGRYVAFIPWPVVEGFTVGIAVIIFLQQVPSALGVAKPEGENTALVAWRAVTAWAGDGWAAIAIAGLVAVLMVALPRLHRTLPASLIAVAAATLVAELANWGSRGSGRSPRRCRCRPCRRSASRTCRPWRARCSRSRHSQGSRASSLRRSPTAWSTDVTTIPTESSSGRGSRTWPSRSWAGCRRRGRSPAPR